MVRWALLPASRGLQCSNKIAEFAGLSNDVELIQHPHQCSQNVFAHCVVRLRSVIKHAHHEDKSRTTHAHQ